MALQGTPHWNFENPRFADATQGPHAHMKGLSARSPSDASSMGSWEIHLNPMNLRPPAGTHRSSSTIYIYIYLYLSIYLTGALADHSPNERGIAPLPTAPRGPMFQTVSNTHLQCAFVRATCTTPGACYTWRVNFLAGKLPS